MSHLIVFDIDGTLIHSHPREVDCFLQALTEVTGISQITKDLCQYEHITETGIINQCMMTALQRLPTSQELNAIEKTFLSLFSTLLLKEPTLPIKGVENILPVIAQQSNISLAIATGSYGRSAFLKLHHANLPLTELPLGSCDDSHDRVEIMKAALTRALIHYQIPSFKKVTYVGDGPWDIKAARDLNWDLIAVASNYTPAQLQAWGATKVIEHYLNEKMFLDLLFSD